MNHASSCPLRPVWAVPVLPAICDARDLRGRAGALVDDVLHHLGHGRRGLLAERAAERRAAALVAERPAGRAHAVDERGPHHDAAVRERRGDHRHLHRRDDAGWPGRSRCAPGRSARSATAACRARADRARGGELVGRVVERRDREEAEALQPARERCAARAPAAELVAELREDAVDRVREREREIEAAREALARVVEDLLAVLLEVAGVGRTVVCAVYEAALERERGDHGLDRRAGRIEALGRAVDERAAGCGQRALRRRGWGRSSATRRSRARAGARLDREHGAGLAARGERAHGLALRRREQRELDVVAVDLAAGERVQLVLERSAEIGVRARSGSRWRSARRRRGRRSPTSSRRRARTSCASGSGARRRGGRRPSSRPLLTASFVPSAARISPRLIESCCTTWWALSRRAASDDSAQSCQ